MTQTRIKTALKRAADLSRDEGVVVEVCAGNVTYRVLPALQAERQDNGKPIDAPDDIRL